VGGVDGTSRNNERLRGVASSLQVRKHLVEAHADVTSNILKQAPSGPECADNRKHVRPEVTVILRAASLPGEGKRLAWVSAANKVNCGELCAVESLDVSPARDAGPVFCENAVAIVINLHLPGARHTSAFKSKREAADASTHVEEGHHITGQCMASAHSAPVA
jgi:hypothetical protein